MSGLGGSWIERLLRRLVRLLPADFRSDFGEAIEADLAERRLVGDRRGLYLREVPSLLSAIAREHASALVQDARYAVRTMRRTPGFTALAILMLALGTGANVAIFSIVDAVMLRSPFPRPSELAVVRFGPPGRATAAVPVDQYRQLQEAPGRLAGVAALGGGSHVLTGRGDPENVDDIECVDAEMFTVLGTPPLLGRTFGPDENRPGAPPTIVLSERFWRQLGGTPDVPGASITLNHTPVTIVGVMPADFAGPLARADVQGWVPLNRPIRDAQNTGCRQGATVNVVARLRPGVALDAAGAALPPNVSLIPLESPILEEVRTPFTVLVLGVLCVLLIACFNVGGLQMERSIARRREMALRFTLGASRGRLVRQTLTENLLLALAAAAAGLVATRLTLGAIVSLLPGNVPYLDQIVVNGRVLALALAVAAAAGLIAGLLPLAELRRASPARDLTDTTRTTGRHGAWGRRALVVAEVALSIVVLIGAGLMVRTFLTLRPVQPGFDPAHKLLMSVRLRGATPEQSESFFGLLLDRLRTTPGVRGAEAATYFPMGGSTAEASIAVDGTPRDMRTNYTTPGFFALMDVPLVAGRRFTDADTRASAPVVIVNQQLASRIRADGHVVGQRIVVQSQGAGTVPVDRTVVGVVANTRESSIDTLARNEAFVPFAQFPVVYQWVVVDVDPGREAAAAASMRAAVRALRPDLVVGAPRPMLDYLGQRMATRRFGAWALGTLAVLAVGLGAIGLMTTVGWWVRQRTRELGVRVALGASRGGLVKLVLRQGLTLAASGVGLGCAAAAGLTRYLEGWIYGVTPLDPATFVGCALIMLAVAAAAVYLPVRRATAIDPVTALRMD